MFHMTAEWTRRKTLRTLVFLCTALCVMCLCAFALAADSGTCGPALTWSVSPDGVLTVSGQGEMTTSPWRWGADAPTIRKAVLNEGVTTVTGYAFYQNEVLTEITLPSSLVSIGSGAFMECTALKTLSLPENIQEIGGSAFYKCFAPLYASIGSPTAMALGRSGSGFSRPGDRFSLKYLFDSSGNCTGLQLTNLDRSVRKLIVPDGVTTLDILNNWEESFIAGKLEYVDLPASISSLSFRSFSGTPRQFYVKVKAGSYAEKWARSHGLNFYNGKKKLLGWKISPLNAKVNWIVSNYITSGMSEREKVRTIHDWLIMNACYDRTYSRYGADGVLLKGTGVCNSYALAAELLLTKAGIANRFLSGTANNGTGGGYAGHAWNLVRVDGQWYHLDCTWDDPTRVNGRVKEDDSSTISGHERYDYFLVTDKQIGKNHRWASGISADNNKVPGYHGNGDVYYYDKTSCYKLNKDKKTAVFASVLNAKRAKLTSLTIPETVTEGGVTYAVREISEEAASGMKKLKKLTLGGKIKKIGENAFLGCEKLQTVTYGGSEADREKVSFKAGNDALFAASWSYGAVKAAEEGEEAEALPAHITAVIKGMTYRLNTEKQTAVCRGPEDRSLTSVEIPAKVKYEGVSYRVTSVADSAFEDMAELKKVTIGKNVTKIGDRAFRGCGKLKQIILNTEKLTSVGSGAFKGLPDKAKFRFPAGLKETYRKLLRKGGAPKEAGYREIR